LAWNSSIVFWLNGVARMGPIYAKA